MYSLRSEVGLHVRSDSTGDVAFEALVATERLQDDPATPPRIAMPLATELAEASAFPGASATIPDRPAGS